MRVRACGAPPITYKAFQFFLRCPEGIRSDHVNIHELRQPE